MRREVETRARVELAHADLQTAPATGPSGLSDERGLHPHLESGALGSCCWTIVAESGQRARTHYDVRASQQRKPEGSHPTPFIGPRAEEHGDDVWRRLRRASGHRWPRQNSREVIPSLPDRDLIVPRPLGAFHGAHPLATGSVPVDGSASSARGESRTHTPTKERQGLSLVRLAISATRAKGGRRRSRAPNPAGFALLSRQARSHDRFTFQDGRYGDQDSNLDLEVSETSVLPLDHPRVRDPRIELGQSTSSGWCRHQTTRPAWTLRADSNRDPDPYERSVPPGA